MANRKSRRVKLEYLVVPVVVVVVVVVVVIRFKVRAGWGQTVSLTKVYRHQLTRLLTLDQIIDSSFQVAITVTLPSSITKTYYSSVRNTRRHVRRYTKTAHRLQCRGRHWWVNWWASSPTVVEVAVSVARPDGTILTGLCSIFASCGLRFPEP